jgi:transcriptional regulator with XRE-family HTH domain
VFTKSSKREQIARSLGVKAYRDAFVASLITVELPAQIREMRLNREWSQADLGARAGMPQAQISRFEQTGYGEFTLTTLRKLASAFDVALKVRLVAFSELVDDAAFPELHGLDVPSFGSDIRLELSGEFLTHRFTSTVAGTGPTRAPSAILPTVMKTYEQEVRANG